MTKISLYTLDYEEDEWQALYLNGNLLIQSNTMTADDVVGALRDQGEVVANLVTVYGLETAEFPEQEEDIECAEMNKQWEDE